MVLRIQGIVLAVWIVFALFGAVFKFLTAALVIGAIVFVGAAAYSAIRNRSRRQLP